MLAAKRDWVSPQFWLPLGHRSYTGSNLSVTPLAIFTADSRLTESRNSEWVYPEQEIKRILVDLFKTVPQVKSICAHFGTEEITVWTLLDSYDRDAREKVYEKELAICRELRVYDFDFRATSVDLVSPGELVQAGSREIYRRV